MILFLTWWFPRAMRVRLTALFMLALPISQAIGNPLSAAVLQYLDGIFGLAGWQALFIVQGVPTIVMGVAAWFYLTDRPRQAKWLTPEERDWLDSRMSVELAETRTCTARRGKACETRESGHSAACTSHCRTR